MLAYIKQMCLYFRTSSEIGNNEYSTKISQGFANWNNFQTRLKSILLKTSTHVGWAECFWQHTAYWYSRFLLQHMLIWYYTCTYFYVTYVSKLSELFCHILRIILVVCTWNTVLWIAFSTKFTCQRKCCINRAIIPTKSCSQVQDVILRIIWLCRNDPIAKGVD